jgi:succinate dehydrogenase/fumarate reductase flavoprotein subunit
VTHRHSAREAFLLLANDRSAVFSTDVLVIGGGPAATWAAVTAGQEGARVVLVDKGYCGTSGVGAAAGIGHWRVPPVPELRRAAKEQRAELGFQLTDPRWQERVLDETWDRLPLLAKWRYPFAHDADGAPILVTSSGPEYLRVMRQQVKRMRATILDHHPALELLTHDGHVVGAAGIERRTGDRWRVHAGAVVLATGGCTWQSKSLGGDVDTGDGQLMAAEVGAQLSSMEFSNYWGPVPKGTSMDKNGFYAFATFTRADGSVLPGNLMVDRSRLARYLLEGPVFAQLDRVPEGLVGNVRQRMINWRQTFDKLGIDPVTERFELDVVNEGTVRGTGGLFVQDDDCSVGVPGLYAAGDVAARDRIVGATTGAGAPNAAWAVASGTWSGRAAARFARGAGTASSHRTATAAGRAGLRPSGAADDDWRAVVQAVQDEMLPIAKNAVRSERILTDSLAVLDAVWTEATDSLRADGPDLLRSRQAAAMTAMGRWAYRSALARPETRGMHYRADHPQLDRGQRHRILTGGLDEVWVRVDDRPLDTSADAATALRSAS